MSRSWSKRRCEVFLILLLRGGSTRSVGTEVWGRFPEMAFCLYQSKHAAYLSSTVNDVAHDNDKGGIRRGERNGILLTQFARLGHLRKQHYGSLGLWHAHQVWPKLGTCRS